MPDEPIIDPNAEPTGGPAEPVTEPVIDPTAEPQTQVDPLKLSPEQQSRHKSAADLEAFANQQQSEADKLRNEFEAYKVQHPTAQTQSPTNDELITEFAADPNKFMSKYIDKAVAPLQAQVGLASYANSGHPEINDPNFMREMEVVINENPALVNDPKGLDMAYQYVKSQFDANKLTEAAGIKTAHNANVQTIKQTTAFVEGSTTPKTQTSPKIVPGMSSAEQNKIMDAQNVGWVKDEDREYD